MIVTGAPTATRATVVSSRSVVSIRQPVGAATRTSTIPGAARSPTRASSEATVPANGAAIVSWSSAASRRGQARPRPVRLGPGGRLRCRGRGRARARRAQVGLRPGERCPRGVDLGVGGALLGARRRRGQRVPGRARPVHARDRLVHGRLGGIDRGRGLGHARLRAGSTPASAAATAADAASTSACAAARSRRTSGCPGRHLVALGGEHLGDRPRHGGAQLRVARRHDPPVGHDLGGGRNGGERRVRGRGRSAAGTAQQEPRAADGGDDDDER